MRITKLLSLCAAFLLAGSGLFAQNLKVTGTVTDAGNGDPLIGAAVVVKGTTNGTSTDIDGRFELNVPSGSTLEFSCIGSAEPVPWTFSSSIIQRKSSITRPSARMSHRSCVP